MRRSGAFAFALALGVGVVTGCGPTPPTIAVSPAIGTREGGVDVRLEGALGYDGDGEPIPVVGHGPVSLYFGQRSALGVVIEGDFLIRAVTPKHEEPGPVDVLLLFDDGVQHTIAAGFEYDANAGVVLRPDFAK